MVRVAVWHDLPSGGGRRALTTHVDGLRSRGHELAVWSTPQDAGPLPLQAGPSVPQLVVGLEVPSPVRDLIDAARARRPATFEVVWKHCEEVAQQVQAWAPDVLFAGSSVTLGAAPLARLLPDVPSVLYLHEPYRPHYENREQRTSRPPALSPARLRELLLAERMRLLREQECRSALAFDVVLVNSLFSRESVRRAFGCASTVCRLGVADDVFAPSDGVRGEGFVSVGELAEHKRPHFLIEAFGRLDQPPRLDWVANRVDPVVASSVERLSRSLGVPFRLHEQISDEALVAMLGASRALVYAPALEPFGFAPVEAALCGTPTIAVAEGGVRETVLHEQTGLLVDDDPAAFAAAVARLQSCPEHGEELGRAARKHALEVYPVEAAIDRLEKQVVAAAERRP